MNTQSPNEKWSRTYMVVVGGLSWCCTKKYTNKTKVIPQGDFFPLAERVPRTQTEHTPQTGLCLLIPDICGVGALVHWWVLSFTADVLG